MSAYCIGPADMCRYHASGGTDTRCGDYVTFPAGHRAGKTRPTCAAGCGKRALPGSAWCSPEWGCTIGKTQPVATAVERLPRLWADVRSRRYHVDVRCGVDQYNVIVSVTDSGKYVLRCGTAAGYRASGTRRALVEQAAREAVLA